jgi:class 3 adenylate cyclase
MDAQVTMQRTSDYMETMSRLIVAHRGVVEEYFGDALKATFGVPFARLTPEETAQDASQAVACALAMGKALQGLNRGWHARGFPMIDMRVGVGTGEVTAGYTGRAQRHKFATSGEAVQLAARLERYLPEPGESTLGPGSCRILIAAATAAYLSEQYWLHPIGTVSPGVAGPSGAAYRVYGRSGRRHLKSGVDLRSAFRVEMISPVTLIRGAPVAGLTSNVSVGGVAICRFSQPLPIGATTVLRFEVPNHGQPIRATGTVIWADEDRAGIAFAELSPSDRFLLESFLAKQTARKSL